MSVRRWLLAVIVLLAAALAGLPRRDDGTALVRVSLPRKGDLERLLRSGADVATWHAIDPERGESAGPAADVLADRAGRAALQRLRLGFRVLVPDLAAVPHPPLAAMAAPVSAPPGFGQGSMGGYYTFGEVVALLDLYAAQYPAIVSAKQSIGTSVEGRPIYAVKVSDHPSQSEAEPRVLLDALHHAREPLSMQTLLYLLHHLVTSYGGDPELTQLIDEREIWIVPVVNPDGYVFNELTAPAGGGLWRKNRRALGGTCSGVDLNRNYPYQWGVDDIGSSPDACSEAFRGSGPGSEPEVAAMAAFAAQQHVDQLCSLHSFGEQLVHPFSHGPVKAADYAAFHAHGARMAQANGYRFGAASDVLLPANGSAIDHQYFVNGARAWTLEIGKTFWPAADQILPLAAENLEALLFLARTAGSYVEPIAIRPAAAAALPGAVVDLAVDLENLGLHAAGPIALTLASADAAASVVAGTASLPGLLPLATAASGAGALRVAIAASATPGARASLTVTATCGGIAVVRELQLEIGAARRIAVDAFETDLGWSTGATSGDTAATGKWTRVDPNPIAQGFELAQPDDDVTPGNGVRCFATGNGGTAAGQDDVDEGFTTLYSPEFDLAAAADPRLRLQRWYWCSTADDPLTVDLSNDGGSTWLPVEIAGGQQNVWKPREWRVAEYLQPTDRMRLRVRAVDETNNSVTEALIDDFEIVDFGSAPHLMALGAVKPGKTFELQVAPAADAAGSPVASAGLLLASARSAAFAVPGIGGLLGLDPGALLVFPPLAVSSAGPLRLPLAVPAGGAIAGASVWFQALLASPAPAFSNAVEVRVQAP